MRAKPQTKPCYFDRYPRAKFGGRSLSRTIGISKTVHFYKDVLNKANAALPNEYLSHIAFNSQLNEPDTNVGARLDLLITAYINGDLELCGCKRLQAGGAARRSGFISTHRNANTVLLDAGHFLMPDKLHRQFEPTDKLQAQMGVALLKRDRYDAINLNPAEKTMVNRLGVSLDGLPLLDALPAMSDSPQGPMIRKVTKVGKKIALVAWNDPPLLEDYNNAYWLGGAEGGTAPHLEALLPVLRDLGASEDGVILIGNIHPLTMRTIVSKVPQLTAIITTDRLPNNFNLLSAYLGRTYIQTVPGSSGEITYLSGTLANGHLYNIGYGVNVLDDEAIADPAVKKSLDLFFNSDVFLESVGATRRSLPNATPHPSTLQSAWVGSMVCKTCHLKEFFQWRATPHSTAFATLSGVHRTHNPGCVSCHVVAFNSPGGYTFQNPVENLRNVGCEACHGSGSAHVMKPEKTNIVRRVTTETCRSCHTPDRSDFDEAVQTYLQKVNHVFQADGT